MQESKGRLANILSLAAAMSHMAMPSYSFAPSFSPEPVTSTLRRKHHTKGGSHKQNLRASKRGGKSHQVRKCSKR